MSYHRYGHMDKVLVKEGDRVKKGQQLGTVGTGNGQFSAHLHYDRPYKKLAKWTNFVFGMTKDQVRQAYLDSRDLEMTVFPAQHHYGWRYLELATYGAKTCYHPGSDLNGVGSGNADLGLPFYSPCDGVVLYCYSGTGTNGGWGKLLVVEEKPSPVNTTSTPVMGESNTTATVPLEPIKITVEAPEAESEVQIPIKPPEPKTEVKLGALAELLRLIAKWIKIKLGR